MKKLLWGFAAFFVIFFVSCGDDNTLELKYEIDFPVPELTDDNTISFNITTSGRQAVELYMQGGNVAVYWGDGTENGYRAPGEATTGHMFNSAGTYHVQIWSDNLTFINLSFLLQHVTGFKMGKCPEMRDLILNSVSDVEHFKLEGCSKLETLNIGNWENLSSLDLSECTNLKELSCYTHPKMTSLDLSENTKLRTLMISGMNIDELDLSHNKSLLYLTSSYLNIKTLDVEALTELSSLKCFNNPYMENIIFPEDNSINELMCRSTLMKNLDVSGLPYLANLDCALNLLTQLDLSACPRLQKLNCMGNRITNIDISNNKNLYMLYCGKNELSADALNKIFKSLPNAEVKYTGTRIPPSPRYSVVYYLENPGSAEADEKILTNKWWMVLKVVPSM